MARPKKELGGRAEYRVHILPVYNDVLRKWVTVFRIETVEEFSSFNYEVVVKETVEEEKIHWKLHGLRSPAISLPNFGPAIFTREYENLRGTYEFVVAKLDGTENVFTLNITDKKVSLMKSPRKRFVDVLTSKQPSTQAL